MSGNWIKMTHSLWTAPEVVAIASSLFEAGPLHARKAAVVGALYRLWCIADLHAGDDGCLHGYTESSLDGDVGIDGFTAAAAAAGWLSRGPKYLRLLNFQYHKGSEAAKRALAFNPLRNHRESRATDPS